MTINHIQPAQDITDQGLKIQFRRGANPIKLPALHFSRFPHREKPADRHDRRAFNSRGVYLSVIIVRLTQFSEQHLDSFGGHLHSQLTSWHLRRFIAVHNAT